MLIRAISLLISRFKKNEWISNNSTENVNMDAAAIGDDEEAVNDNEECSVQRKSNQERKRWTSENYIMFSYLSNIKRYIFNYWTLPRM